MSLRARLMRDLGHQTTQKERGQHVQRGQYVALRWPHDVSWRTEGREWDHASTPRTLFLDTSFLSTVEDACHV